MSSRGRSAARRAASRGPGVSPRWLKLGLIAFWALWLTVVVVTNVLDALRALGLLGPDWPVASGNFDAIVKTTSVYAIPLWLNALMFAGVIVWEALGAGLLWRACLEFRAGHGATAPSIHAAFGVSLSLFAGFVVAAEVFLAYALEATHLRIFIGLLVTLLALHLLPDEG